MTRRQQIEAQALLRSSEFAATRSPDFTHQPATPVDLKYASARTRLTAAIPVALRSGKSAIKTLSAIYRRIYKGNLEVLTAWKTASHVHRAARPAAPVPGPVVQS